MDRKNFIKKSLLGAVGITTGASTLSAKNVNLKKRNMLDGPKKYGAPKVTNDCWGEDLQGWWLIFVVVAASATVAWLV